MTLHDYASVEDLHAAVAEVLSEATATAISERGHAWLALAGGRTPLPAYRAFAGGDLDWSRVAVVATDERCVPHAHPASNHASLVDAFAEAKGVVLHSLTSPDGDADRSLVAARGMFAHGQPRESFDVVVLGMGADAHFASLFPGAPGLDEALHPEGDADVVHIDPDPLPPEAPFPRLSLTLARLLRARVIHLVITGEAKREVLLDAAGSDDPLRHPVAALLHAGLAPLHLHWAA